MLASVPVEPTVEEISEALDRTLRSGLPASAETAGELLPELRCCYGRASHPRDRLSRIQAFNVIITERLHALGDGPSGQAARLLFRADPTVANLNLTERQKRAAVASGHEVTHFRKRIRPKLVTTVAQVLLDYDRAYRPRTEGRPPPVVLSGERPEVTAAHYTPEEEAISRIWSYVYGLRAELIAAGRFKNDATNADQFRYAIAGVLWQGTRLMAAVAGYLDRYGGTIMHGEVEYAAEGVIRLAGWRLGSMTDDDAQWLRYVLNSVGREDRKAFVGRVVRSSRGKQLLEEMERWV